MYIEQTTLSLPGWPTLKIVDFQTPLKSKRSDPFGKIDLLGAGDELAVIELKVLRADRGADTPLNAILEAVGYCAVVESNLIQISGELRAAGHPVGLGGLAALILAPDDYWDRWDRTRTGAPWRSTLSEAAALVSKATGLRVGFGAFDIERVGASLDVTDPTA